MPLDSVAERYAQTLFLARMEELTKQYTRRMSETGAELARGGMTGHYHAEMARVGIEHIKELTDARVDSLLAAYERAECPIDEQAVKDINRAAVEYCDAQAKYLVAQAQERAARSAAPPGVAQQLAATIASAMSGIKARVNRRLSALRDEQILAARSASQREAAAPRPDVTAHESAPPAGAFIIRLWDGSAKWAWYGGFFLGACTLITLDEYFFGIPLLLLSAISLLSRLAHSKKQRILKSVGVIGIVCAFVTFLFIAVTIKGSKPWTHLQAPLTALLGFDTTTPPHAPKPPSPPASDLPHKGLSDNAVPKSGPILQINSAPNGIAIGGGTVVNPIVNNYGTQSKPDRTMSDADRKQIVSYLSQNKAAIRLTAPYGDREATSYALLWYGIFKDAGWTMKDAIVLAYMTVGGNPTPGAILYERGERGQPGEQTTFQNTEPLAFVANSLRSQRVPIWLQRDPKQDDGLITIQFGPRPD
jgi:hypothetical protein